MGQWKKTEHPESEAWCINQSKLITNMSRNFKGFALTVYFLFILSALLLQMTTR